MSTTWNIDVFVTPKKGKENEVKKILEDSDATEFSVDVNQEFVEKGKKRVEFIASSKEETASYDYGEFLPKLLADKLKNKIDKGKIFMKEVETESSPFPADFTADLIKRKMQIRSNQLIDEVF
jgi:hypothetical protein